jgi:flagellar hook-associated protein 2
MQSDILTSLNRSGTGINISELAESLTEAEIAPRETLITGRIDRAELRLSGYDRLRGQAEQVTEALGLMRGLAPFAVRSDSAAVGVTVTDPGAVDLQTSRLSVSQLASAQVLSFGGYNDPAQEVGGGALTVDFGRWSGDEPPVFIPGAQSAQTITFAPDSTLGDMATALSTLEGVSARVIDLGDGSYALGVISETGAGNALRFGVAAGADPGLAAFDFSAGPGAVEAQAARDARLSLNGIEVTRPDNRIDDLLPGVSLTLTGTTLTPATVTAAPNTEGALEVMQSFVDIVNATGRLVGTLTARGFAAGTEAGDLAGDALAEGMMTRIEGILGRGFGASGVHLSDLGITTERDGSLTLDEARFTAALNNDPALLDALVRDGITGRNVEVAGAPATGAEAGRFTLLRDPATGEATLAGVPVFGTVQENGDWIYNVTSGPMRGVRLTVGAETERAEIGFAPSMVSSLQAYLSGVLSPEGALADREATLSDTISVETTALEALDRRAEEVRGRYLSRFTEMERIVTQLNSTGDYLTNLIDAWNSDN